MRRVKTLAIALAIGAAVIAPLLFAPRAALGQYPGGGGYPGASGWVPCDANGVPLPSGDPGISGSGAILETTGATPYFSASGTYAQLTDWWQWAYTPNALSVQGAQPLYWGLGLSSNASNVVTTPDGYSQFGYYDPIPMAPGPGCPDIGGSVTSSLTDILTAHFIWTGSGPPPNPATFLVATSVSASAGVSYENAAVASGLSSSASSAMGSLAVSATSPASGPEEFNQQSSYILKKLTPDANGMVTISVPAYETGVSSNGVNEGIWINEPDGSWEYEITNGPTIAYSGATANGVAAPDNRGVYISANIETSYYKGTNQQGAVVPVPNVRNTDGSMSGDTVVSWNDVFGVYEGDIGYTANTPSFISPAYSWTPGGSLVASALLDQPTAVFRFGFGSTDVGPALNQATTTSLQVTDSDGAVGTNTYTINWHYPVENWAAIGARYEIAPVFIAASSVNQPTNGQVNFDVPSAEVDCSAGAKTLGGILTTSGAVLAIVAPETDPIIIGLMAAGGYTLSMVEPPPPTQYTEYGTEAHFDQDVASQVAINNGELSGVFEPSINRFNQPTRADMIEESGDEHGWFSGQEGYAFMFGVQCYRRQFYQPYIGDAYGANGYTGMADGEITNPGNLEYVYTWY